jgi:hypothetical protein
MKIISIDAATKSLAIACLEFNNITENINSICKKIYYSEGNINDLVEQLYNEYNPIQIKSLDVVDLIPHSKVSECDIIDISNALFLYMNNYINNLIKENWFDDSINILIEYQMGPNHKSGNIQIQLIYHFLNFLPKKNIHLVHPSLKNKLYFSNITESYYSYHRNKYKKKYTSNKSHTKYLFLNWLNAYGQNNKINIINKKNYSDIADAFCQAVSWNLLKISSIK